jgi:hypothetical protein
MSPTLKRKGKHILSPSTKKARGQVVRNLAVQVHELQEEAVNLEGQTDGSSFGSKKYGSIKRIITEAVKVYPWMDRNKVYNGIKAIKKKQQAQQVVPQAQQGVPPDDVVTPSRVLQFSTIGNQHHNEDNASQNKSGRPKGSTAMVRLHLREKRKRAIDLVATRYSKEKIAHGGKLPVRSFVQIRDETLEELSLHDENVHIKHQTILSRLQGKSLFAVSRGVRSPMEKVEPVILKFALPGSRKLDK